MKFERLLALALIVGSLSLSGCGGPPVDNNAATDAPAPQEADPAAYDKEQAKLNRR